MKKIKIEIKETLNIGDIVNIIGRNEIVSAPISDIYHKICQKTKAVTTTYMFDTRFLPEYFYNMRLYLGVSPTSVSINSNKFIFNYEQNINLTKAKVKISNISSK